MTNQVTKLEQPVSAPAVVTPSQILAKAYEQGASIEQLTQLLDLQDKFYAQQEKLERRDAEREFNIALSRFKQEAPVIVKDQHVKFGTTDFKHASLANAISKISDTLSNHGLSTRWDTDQDGGVIKVTCILSHKLGHEARVTLSSLPDSSGGKNSIQAVGSAVSYLQRYTLFSILGLAASDQDDDGISSASSYISFEQVQEIETLLSNVGGDSQRLVEHFGVSSISELPADKYKTIVSTIKAKAAKK